jgi:hypothetical protein
MWHRYATAGLAAVVLLGTAACKDFLTRGDAGTNPNSPTSLTIADPLYIAVEAAQAIQFEGQLERFAGLYTQQLAGAARQQQGFDLYTVQPTDVDSYWQGVYGSGGLIDIRKIQQISLSHGDSTYAGIAKVWEALVMGMAASYWGAIPYSDAVKYTEKTDPTVTKPKFDPQLQVYTEVQAQLDTALIFLKASGPSNAGPGGAELIYAGRTRGQLRTVYTQVAHTLKARFYMHVAAVDPANYARAVVQADSGISTPANDFNFYHNLTTSSQNIHYQFYNARTDVAPGAAIINLMKARIASGKDIDTDRLAFYFIDACGNDSGDPKLYFGYRPGADANLPGGGGSPAGTCGKTDAGGSYSDFFYVASLPDFHQPMITFAETKLIIAEACLRPEAAAACGPGQALSAYNAERANETYGATSSGPVTFAPQPPAASITLQDVMEEKYIDLFLNPEVWSDYKRTCLPPLAPAPSNSSSSTPGTQIPGRIPYGLSEINTNRANIPPETFTNPNGLNADQPKACPALQYPPAF